MFSPFSFYLLFPQTDLNRENTRLREKEDVKAFWLDTIIEILAVYKIRYTLLNVLNVRSNQTVRASKAA